MGDMETTPATAWVRVRAEDTKQAAVKLRGLATAGAILLACVAVAGLASRQAPPQQLAAAGADQWPQTPPQPRWEYHATRLDQYGNPTQIPLQAPRAAYAPEYRPQYQQQQLQLEGSQPPVVQQPPAAVPPVVQQPPAQPLALQPPAQPLALQPQAMADSDPAEAEAEAPAPPERNPPIPRAPARDWSKIGNGDVSPRAGGNGFGSAGPTSAAEGADESLEDYQKVKGERRFAMDFCAAKFSSWANIQKCIHELFKGAHY